MWGKRWTNGMPFSVAVDPHGDVIVTGQSFNGANNDGYTVK
jgi:hypothetical protein